MIISLAAFVAFAIIGYVQLYKSNNTSEFMYRVTRVLPLSVAVIDGQGVPYSDYLMKYRSSIHYLEQKEQVNLKTDDGKRQIEYIKQQSMSSAIADALAQKIASDKKIAVSDKEVFDFIKKQRQSSDGEISEQTYEAVILDYYGWSPEEYRHITKNNLVRQKVAYAIDDAALATINGISSTLKTIPATNLSELAAKLLKESFQKTSYGNSGWVPRSNQDGGLAESVSELDVNQLSGIVKSTNGDGYYIVRLLAENDAQVKYEYIHVSLSTFVDLLGKTTNDSKKTVKYI
jgi:hypothetical protein